MPTRTIATRSANLSISRKTVTKTYRKSNKALYKNECLWLRSLASLDFTPTNVSCSDEDLSITMDYCGEPISSENAPPDWDIQLRQILSAMTAADCHHGDLLQQNILVQDGQLFVIDFATACSRDRIATKKKRTYSDDYTENRLRFFLHDVNPGTEIHVFVVWSLENVESVETQINEKMQVVDKITFTPNLYADYGMDRITWLKQFYNTPYLQGSPKGKKPFCAFVVSCENPDYEPRRRVFVNEWRTVNANIFDLKRSIRKGREGFLHSSDNLEEARRNLRWLAYDNTSLPYRYVTWARPQFASLSDAFKALNNLRDTRYVLMRRPAVENTDGSEDYDILCDDYFKVKQTLGGFAYKISSNKLFQNVGTPYDEGGFKVANRVNITGNKVPFDIRYIGDGYYPVAWQKRMLENRILEKGAYVCSPEDEFLAKAYHVLFHKLDLPAKYHKYFQSQLNISDPAEIKKKLMQLTLENLRKSNSGVPRPKDFTIPFRGPTKTEYAGMRELFLVRREVRTGNYSGASKVLGNYIRTSGRRLFGSAALLFLLYRWQRADSRDYLVGLRRKLKRKTKSLKSRLLKK